MHPHHLPPISLISLPKSGSFLLLQLFQGLPGLTQTRKNVIRSPLNPGELSIQHLPYSSAAESMFRQTDTRVFIITRDLRDVAVSTVHFIMNRFPQHVLHPIFSRCLTRHEQRLMAIIRGLDYAGDIPDSVLANETIVRTGSLRYPDIDERNRPILQWLSSTLTCHVRFEDLVQSPETRRKTVMKMVHFLWDHLQHSGHSKRVYADKMIQHIDSAASSTFRKGRVGEWKKEFSPEHKQAFKEVAGKRLVELKYEKNLRW
jgi:hypothetical protein